MAALALDAPPPVLSGTELILAALKHPSPLTRTETTDMFGDTVLTWGAAVWESENLLRVAAVSKKLCAAATVNRLWEPLLDRFKEHHPWGKEDTGDCTDPVYPERAHGPERDRHSLLPHEQDREVCDHVPALVLSLSAMRLGRGSRLDEATGDMVEKFHPVSEDPGTGWANNCPTSVWLKRPPALLWCQTCGGLSFDCGRSFKEHCSGWKHHQLMLPPKERLPEELWDPRLNREAFAALTPQRRYLAIRQHVETILAAFDAPVDEAGILHMQQCADVMREDVALYEGISEEERDEAAARCTADAVADAIRQPLLVRDCSENGLTAGSSDAHDFFAGQSRG
ncbi:hypothetical protein FOA52_002423 [Chlamydomonas sp. UWO 241]|nr:hypothetical protein FOA52_002423 [Chlamydomonas sp. UWO 241]